VCKLGQSKTILTTLHHDGTCTADFTLRQNESRLFLGKYSDAPRVPWRHKKQGMMAIAGIITVTRERDNVVYWKTKRKINDDLQR